jgi:hypothetical protein
MSDLLLLDKRDKNKKAVSEIVSYTLLIVIAIGVSSLVYYFLQLQTPKEKTECKEGISLGIDYVKLECDQEQKKGELWLSLLNNGRFKVDAAYIRVGEEGKSVRYLVNDPSKEGDHKFYLIGPDAQANPGLLPNDVSLIRNHSTTVNVPYNPQKIVIPIILGKLYILEIEPAILSEITGKLAACENAVITQKIACFSP